ncbi:rhodanese-like domain-containing protein [Geoglobus sp.]
MRTLVVLVILAIVLSGCVQTESSKGTGWMYKDISVDEAWRLVEEHRGDENFVVLDVRSHDDFVKGHIEGAINVDVFDKEFPEKVKELGINKTYLVYCKTGFRSRIAAKMMVELGIKDVYNMVGGIDEWIKRGYPLSGSG